MSPYVSILLLFGFGLLVAGGFVVVSALLGPKKKSEEKLSPYECGIPQTGNIRERFPVKFYLVAITFVVFDVEVVFFYPWAVTFKKAIADGMGWPFFIGMMVFTALLVVGLIYEYGKKVLDWR